MLSVERWKTLSLAVGAGEHIFRVCGTMRSHSNAFVLTCLWGLMRLLATTHVIPSHILWHETHLHHGHEHDRCCSPSSLLPKSVSRTFLIGTGNKECRVNVGNHWCICSKCGLRSYGRHARPELSWGEMSFLKQALAKELECPPGQGTSARHSAPWTATQFRIAPNSATTDTRLLQSSLCFSLHISDHQKARPCNHIVMCVYYNNFHESIS